jgi:single-stranded-DNA-specific exonuclease
MTAVSRPDPNGIPKALWRDAERAAEIIADASRVAVASHVDADGISAAAIASTALARASKRSEARFFKKLDDAALKELMALGADLIWFTDLGSGSAKKIEGIRAVVSDHHALDEAPKPEGHDGQKLLTDFSTVMQVNPQMHGISGANELSGAGSTYLTALALDRRNEDLAYLGVLGAVGDLQDQKTRRLEGLNRALLETAERLGSVEEIEDIRFFGRETRPIHKLLEFSSDPFVPRVSGSEEGAISFLLELGIELKDGDSWRTWTDLTGDEKEKIITELSDYLLEMKRKPEAVARLMGKAYVLKKERKGTPVRDAKEFATLLNACGRHGKADIGLKICMGDRGDALAEGEALLKDHRSAISKALAWAKGNGIIRMRNIQFFDAGDEIEDTIVGTVAGMLLGGEGADRSVPMVAFAESTEYSDEPNLKASARGTQDLVSKGMDLSVAIRSAAEKVGGVGGGHNIAAGATIPMSRKDDFLDALDRIVGAQLTSRARRRG